MAQAAGLAATTSALLVVGLSGLWIHETDTMIGASKVAKITARERSNLIDTAAE